MDGTDANARTTDNDTGGRCLTPDDGTQMITRFAPSPTGPLHLGHAYSAMVAHDMARAMGGTFLVRIEDLDAARCKRAWEQAIDDDLTWLGLSWPQPVLRQSDHTERYAAAIAALSARGLVYPCGCSRGDIRTALSAPQEGATLSGPDGLVYPGTCRGRSMDSHRPGEALRLDMTRALDMLGPVNLSWDETGPLDPGCRSTSRSHLVEGVGDIVLGRKESGAAAYHLASVVDDAAQGVTHVIRGQDLAEATPIHVLLQALLRFSTPIYHHHKLIRNADGKRLAKRDDARAIALYRASGITPQQIRQMVGL